MKILGNGVRAYRIVQELLEPDAELPAPQPVQLTENARRLGAKLRDRLRETRSGNQARVPDKVNP